MRHPIHPLRSCLLAATMLTAGGCATDGVFPSLAVRPGEGEVSLDEPVRTLPPVAGDAQLQARGAELLARAQRGQRDFDAAYRAASGATARAGAAGSESWLEAQQAISRVEAARIETTAALAELDTLTTQRANQPTNAQDFAALTAALGEARSIAAAQQERLERLRASVRTG